MMHFTTAVEHSRTVRSAALVAPQVLGTRLNGVSLLHRMQHTLPRALQDASALLDSNGLILQLVHCLLVQVIKVGMLQCIPGLPP